MWLSPLFHHYNVCEICFSSFTLSLGVRTLESVCPEMKMEEGKKHPLPNLQSSMHIKTQRVNLPIHL